MGLSAEVGTRLPPLQSHAIQWVRDGVRVIVALHQAINKVENCLLDGIRHHDAQSSPITYQSSSHLFPSSLFCFLVLGNHLPHCGYTLPTLLKTKPPFSELPKEATVWDLPSRDFCHTAHDFAPQYNQSNVTDKYWNKLPYVEYNQFYSYKEKLH